VKFYFITQGKNVKIYVGFNLSKKRNLCWTYLFLYVRIFISFSSFNIFNILYFYFSQFEVDISIIIRLPWWTFSSQHLRSVNRSENHVIK